MGKGVQVDADVLHRMQKAFGNTWGDVLSNLQRRSQVSCLASINDEFEKFHFYQFLALQYFDTYILYVFD